MRHQIWWGWADTELELRCWSPHWEIPSKLSSLMIPSCHPWFSPLKAWLGRNFSSLKHVKRATGGVSKNLEPQFHKLPWNPMNLLNNVRNRKPSTCFLWVQPQKTQKDSATGHSLSQLWWLMPSRDKTWRRSYLAINEQIVKENIKKKYFLWDPGKKSQTILQAITSCHTL